MVKEDKETKFEIIPPSISSSKYSNKNNSKELSEQLNSEHQEDKSSNVHLKPFENKF